MSYSPCYHEKIEGVINSRPLSYVSSSNIEEPLTPSHLILERRLINLPGYGEHVVDDPEDEEFEVDATRPQKISKSLEPFLEEM